jgi:hypothetical protein
MILTQAYTLKEGSVVPPTTYLGADVHQHMLNNTVDLETLPCLLIHISKEHFLM